jgi:4-cresol dehydrogenase (hydroxylating)
MTAPTRPPPSSQALAWATVAWRKHLGEPHVVLDRDVVDPAEIATFATEHRVAAILRPGRRAEVQACLRVATAHEVPVYPVSRGANWGYGSRVPTSHGAVLLDLSRMERVVDVDLVLGTLTVEPGVTFADVEERLRGTGWMLPSPGSSPGASVVGNTVDGGVCDGLVPLRRRAVLEVEVVTPDGEVLRTGLGAFPDARARGAHPGVGPDLTGLFLQSNLGVVTRMTIALQRVPPRQAAVHLQLYDDARLPGLVDAVRIVLRDGLIEGSVTFYDEIRLLAMTTRYPYGEVGGATPLPEAWLAEVREALGGSRWIVEASVRSTDGARLDSARRTLIEALTPWADRVDFAADAPTPQFTPRAPAHRRDRVLA